MTAISGTGRCNGNARHPAARRATGFTLVELLVVLVILGVMSSFIAISLTNDPRRETETEAARLRLVLETALQEAQLTGRPLAWVPQSAGPVSGYRFLQADLDRRWQAVTKDEQLRPRELAEGMRIAAITVDGQAISPDAMLVLPSSGAPVFRIDLDTPLGRYVLQARPNGRVDLIPPKKP